MALFMERRICCFSDRPIQANDRASVQLLLAKLDPSGRATGEKEIIDICGQMRKSGEIDSHLTDYARNH